MIGPVAGSEIFELRARVFIVSELRFEDELCHIAGRTVATVDGQLHVCERVGARDRSRMDVPCLVDGPKLLSRNEFLQAFKSRDMLVVALLNGRSAGWSVLPAEPIGRRTPGIGAFHV